jgi:hypothetical protein
MYVCMYVCVYVYILHTHTHTHTHTCMYLWGVCVRAYVLHTHLGAMLVEKEDGRTQDTHTAGKFQC